MRFPHIIRTEQQLKSLRRYNRAAKIVEEYGYDYVNMDEYCEKAAIDKPGDFHDTEHLMLEGQIKFTDYLADFLVQRYNLKPSQLTQKQKADWEKCVQYMDAAKEYYKDYIGSQHDGKDRVVYEKEDIIKMLGEYL